MTAWREGKLASMACTQRRNEYASIDDRPDRDGSREAVEEKGVSDGDDDDALSPSIHAWLFFRGGEKSSECSTVCLAKEKK